MRRSPKRFTREDLKAIPVLLKPLVDCMNGGGVITALDAHCILADWKEARKKE